LLFPPCRASCRRDVTFLSHPRRDNTPLSFRSAP